MVTVVGDGGINLKKIIKLKKLLHKMIVVGENGMFV